MSAAKPEISDEFFVSHRTIMRMNRLKATRRIFGKYPNAKSLLVTQYNDRELREAASEAGAYGFVLKKGLSELHRFLVAPVEQLQKILAKDESLTLFTDKSRLDR